MEKAPDPGPQSAPSSSKNELSSTDEGYEKRKDRIFSGIFTCIIRQAVRFHADRHGPLQLLMYFHGGLNSEADVHDTASASWELIEKDGYYPIFMVWPTGFWRSYGEEVSQIRNGDRERDGDGAIFAHVMEDTLGGAGAAPAAWADSAKNFNATGFGFGSSTYSVGVDNDWWWVPPGR